MKLDQLHTLVSARPNTAGESIMDPTRYSTFSRLTGVTTTVLGAVQQFKKAKKSEGVSPAGKHVDDSDEAEILWVKSAQKTISEIKSLTKQFNLFKDDKGMWRCGGKVANAQIPYATEFLILLPKSHPTAILIVRQAHNHVLHNAV